MPFNTDPSPHLRDYYQKTTDWATSLRAQYDEDEKKEAHWIAQKVAVSNQREKADAGVTALAMVNKVLDTTPAFMQWREQVKKKSEEKVHLKLASFKMSKEDREAFNTQWEKSQEEDIRFNKVSSTSKDPALKEYIQSLHPGKIKHAKSYFSKVKAQNLGKIFIDAQEANAKDSSGVPFLEKLEAVEKEGAVAYSDFITNWAGEQLVEGSLSNGLIAKNVMPSIDSFVKTENSRFAKKYKDKATTDNDTEIEQTLEMDLNYQSILSDGQGGLSVDPNTPLKTISFATRNLAAKLVPEDIPAGMTADQYAGKIVWGKVFSRAEKGLISEAQKTQILYGLVTHGAGKELLNGEKAAGPALLLKNAGYSVSDFSEAVERGQRASLELQVTEKHSQGEKQANAQMLKCSNEGCTAEEVASTIETLKRDFAGYNNDDLNRMKSGANNDPDLYKALKVQYADALRYGRTTKWSEEEITLNSKGNQKFAQEIRKFNALVKEREATLQYSDKELDNEVNIAGKFGPTGAPALTINGKGVANELKNVQREAFIAAIQADPTNPNAYIDANTLAKNYFTANGGGKGNPIKGKFSSGDKDDYSIYQKLQRERLGITLEANKTATPENKSIWEQQLFLDGELQPPNTYGQISIEDFAGMKEIQGYSAEVITKALKHGMRPGDYVTTQWKALQAKAKTDPEIQNKIRSLGLEEIESSETINQQSADLGLIEGQEINVGLGENIIGVENDVSELGMWDAARGDTDLIYALKYIGYKNLQDYPQVLKRLNQRVNRFQSELDAQAQAAKAAKDAADKAEAKRQQDLEAAQNEAAALQAKIEADQKANDEARGRSLADDLVKGTQAAVANPAQYFGTNQFGDQTPDLDKEGKPLPPLEYKGF